MRVKITDIHPEDEFYDRREVLIGEIGEFKIDDRREKDYYRGVFLFDENVKGFYYNHVYFFGIKYEVLDEKIK